MVLQVSPTHSRLDSDSVFCRPQPDNLVHLSHVEMKTCQNRDLPTHTVAAASNGYLAVLPCTHKGRYFIGGMRSLNARHLNGVQPGDVVN